MGPGGGSRQNDGGAWSWAPRRDLRFYLQDNLEAAREPLPFASGEHTYAMADLPPPVQGPTAKEKKYRPRAPSHARRC